QHHIVLNGAPPGHAAPSPDGNGSLLFEFGADEEAEARDAAEQFVDSIEEIEDGPSTKLVEDHWEQAKLWQVREAGLGATARVPGERETHPGWEDAAVAPDQVGAYLRKFRALLDDYDYEASLYGHLGQGCIHCRIDFVLDTAAGVAQFRSFLDRAAELVVEHGGS